MASSSRSFQSQTVQRLVALYRQTAEGLDRAGLWSRVGLVWATQVVLYPIYGVFQSSRRVYRWLRATDPIGQVGAALRNGETELADQRLAAPPIESLLSWLQLPTQTPLDAALLQLPDACTRLAVGNFQQRPLATRLQPLAPLGQSPIMLQGVATDLSQRSLVLVGSDNCIFNVLSPAEQATLAKLISWLVAAQNHRQWRQRQRLKAFNLPPLSPNRRAWWPVQGFQRLMRWVSLGPVARLTNLFGEAQHHQALWHSRQLSYRRWNQIGDNARLALQPLAGGRLQPQSSIEVSPVGPLSRLEPAVSLPAQSAQHVVQPPRLGLSTGSESSLPKAIETSSQTSLPQAAWIETKAVVVGYLDHPLVSVLRWIDWGLLWLEQAAQRSWRWVRSHVTF